MKRKRKTVIKKTEKMKFRKEMETEKREWKVAELRDESDEASNGFATLI